MIAMAWSSGPDPGFGAGVVTRGQLDGSISAYANFCFVPPKISKPTTSAKTTKRKKKVPHVVGPPIYILHSRIPVRQRPPPPAHAAAPRREQYHSKVQMLTT